MGEAAANQSPPFADINLYLSDTALREAVVRGGGRADAEGLAEFGAEWGGVARLDLGRLANQHPPRLRRLDPAGERLDVIEFHPAWHDLMRAGMAHGLHNSTWNGGSHVARAARVFMAYQAESGHMCPVTMTHAAVAALRAEPDMLARWLPLVAGNAYDASFKPWWEKSAVTLGMGMTERQGGTDVRANSTQATRHGKTYEITGHKWFMSAPMCDAFLVLAQASGGLTCFLMPRFRPNGAVNGLHFQRLKDKLGNRSNASGEVTFVAAFAERVGAEGQGVRTIIEMVQLTRLDCAIASAGLMRFGLAVALHHARHRAVFGRTLASQPAMQAVLADLALEVEAMTALVFRLALACDRAPADPSEAAYVRLLTPAIKYLVCKAAPGFLYEAMECLGGNGYVEESPLARAYREAPVNAIWEGSGNVMALDVLRAAKRAPDAAAAVVTRLGAEAGEPARAQALIDDLARQEPEAHARMLTENLARLATLAAMRAGPAAVAEAYAAARLGPGARGGWGACGPGFANALLLERALPVSGLV